MCEMISINLQLFTRLTTPPSAMDKHKVYDAHNFNYLESFKFSDWVCLMLLIWLRNYCCF